MTSLDRKCSAGLSLIQRTCFNPVLKINCLLHRFLIPITQNKDFIYIFGFKALPYFCMFTCKGNIQSSMTSRLTETQRLKSPNQRMSHKGDLHGYLLKLTKLPKARKERETPEKMPPMLQRTEKQSLTRHRKQRHPLMPSELCEF
ncbi:hypothetical protein AB205_0023650 [Aquarana catesbeiana]|uniref:Uncharacterized protein n=1 Tax=Aquarana catesbeiana TaxID=8400 RepID=A0A2G9RY57_AQUCT|nr:hypothetical protein AB205_0023650 [Aquarana catesbeiana]